MDGRIIGGELCSPPTSDLDGPIAPERRPDRTSGSGVEASSSSEHARSSGRLCPWTVKYLHKKGGSVGVRAECSSLKAHARKDIHE
eukprot:scaffold87715_cov32-Tisochrysis_lutea.AAC.2